ncbi:MAG: HAMP domain-containing histidine kinase [Bacilli bacterium]|nr:HAMP domain-containing histidine kinase [Bacilli bacterium]
MHRRFTLRKRVFTGLILAICFNFISLFVFSFVYLKPNIDKVSNEEELLKEEILSNDYENYTQLISKLDSITSIKYALQDTDNNFLHQTDVKRVDKAFIATLIKINDVNYLLQVYYVNNVNVSKIIVLFFEIQAFLMLLIFIIAGFSANKGILRPLDKLNNDICNYKFGKKPIRSKVKNEFDLIQNEFVNLTDSLEEEKDEQTRIIASISHDIKTPLTSIIGYSDLIASDSLKQDEIKKYNEKINLKSKMIKEILNNFDDYLINNTNQTLKLEKIKLKDLIEQLDNDYKMDLETNNIKLLINCNCFNDNIMIDIMKIKRVFSNIISNSVRYLKNNGFIKISIKKNNNDYIFKITDNGPGVDEKIINKIFEPLYTTDYSRKISGLGLSICKEFIILHGGSIKAYNNYGLTIEFTIPIINK